MTAWFSGYHLEQLPAFCFQLLQVPLDASTLLKEVFLFFKRAFMGVSLSFCPCVSGCGCFMAPSDSHKRCLTCLGFQHTEAAFVDDWIRGHTPLANTTSCGAVLSSGSHHLIRGSGPLLPSHRRCLSSLSLLITEGTPLWPPPLLLGHSSSLHLSCSEEMAAGRQHSPFLPLPNLPSTR